MLTHWLPQICKVHCTWWGQISSHSDDLEGIHVDVLRNLFLKADHAMDT